MAPCQPRRAQPAVSSMPNWGHFAGIGSAHSSTMANRACPAVASAKADLPHVLLACPDEPRDRSGHRGCMPLCNAVFASA